MKVLVNGEDREVKRGDTVRSLIEAMGLGQGACAAEINKVLVPRREHDAKLLQEGDRVEIVSLVGGG